MDGIDLLNTIRLYYVQTTYYHVHCGRGSHMGTSNFHYYIIVSLANFAVAPHVATYFSNQQPHMKTGRTPIIICTRTNSCHKPQQRQG